MAKGTTQTRDGRREEILRRGAELAEAVLAQQGLEASRSGNHIKCRVPWRDDSHPSLEILATPDGNVPAGSFIDRGNPDDKGDVFTLCARLWKLDAANAFVGTVLKEHRNDGNPVSLDGGWFQDKLEEFGYLAEREVTEPCGGNCACADAAMPTSCYFLTPLGEECVAAANAYETKRNEQPK